MQTGTFLSGTNINTNRTQDTKYKPELLQVNKYINLLHLQCKAAIPDLLQHLTSLSTIHHCYLFQLFLLEVVSTFFKFSRYHFNRVNKCNIIIVGQKVNDTTGQNAMKGTGIISVIVLPKFTTKYNHEKPSNKKLLVCNFL